MVEAPSCLVTFEEFLALPGEGKREWVAGRVIETDFSDLDHDHIRSFLAATLGNYLAEKGLGTLTGEKYVQRLPDSGRAPDVSVFRKANEGRVRRLAADGPADFVIAIVSPSSRLVDRGEKFYEYEAAGIEEYWILDPDRKTAEFYRLTDGRYGPVLPDAQDRVHSSVIPGFFIKVGWLWSRPKPTVVLRELGLIP